MRAGLLSVCAVFLVAPTLVLVAFSAHSYAATGQPSRPNTPGTAHVVSSSLHDPPPIMPPCHRHHPPHCHRHHPPHCRPYYPARRQPWCQCAGPTEFPFPVPTVTVPPVVLPTVTVPPIPVPVVSVPPVPTAFPFPVGPGQGTCPFPSPSPTLTS